RLCGNYRHHRNHVRRPNRIAKRPNQQRGKARHEHAGNHIPAEHVTPAQSFPWYSLFSHDRQLFDINFSAHLAASFFSASAGFWLSFSATKNLSATSVTLPVLSRFALPWMNTVSSSFSPSSSRASFLMSLPSASCTRTSSVDFGKS